MSADPKNPRVGDVFVATFCGRPNTAVIRYDTGSERGWIGQEPGDITKGEMGGWFQPDSAVIDLRPVEPEREPGTYVVRLTDEQARAAAAEYPGDVPVEKWGRLDNQARQALADAIRAQLRMAEPGWGERVIAHTDNTPLRRPFVNAYTGCEVGTTWTDIDGYHAAWSDLIDPEPWRAES